MLRAHASDNVKVVTTLILELRVVKRAKELTVAQKSKHASLALEMVYPSLRAQVRMLIAAQRNGRELQPLAMD
jgi:hypothetical protein